MLTITRYNLALDMAKAGLFELALKQVVHTVETWHYRYLNPINPAIVHYSRLHVALLIAMNDIESAIIVQERYVKRMSRRWFLGERSEASISKRDLNTLKEMLAEKRTSGSRPVNRTSMVGLQDVLPR
jgi:hypothetical protein